MLSAGKVFLNKFLLFTLCLGCSSQFLQVANAADCEIDGPDGHWVEVTDRYDKCTPPTTVTNPDMTLTGTAYGGNFKVNYRAQYTNAAGCGNYGAWGWPWDPSGGVPLSSSRAVWRIHIRSGAISPRWTCRGAGAVPRLPFFPIRSHRRDILLLPTVVFPVAGTPWCPLSFPFCHFFPAETGAGVALDIYRVFLRPHGWRFASD